MKTGKLSKRVATFSLLCASIGAAGTCRASTLPLPYPTPITVEYNGSGFGSNVNIDFGAHTNWNVWAGIYNWKPVTTYNHAPAPANPWPLNQNFSSFCIDLKEVFSANTVYQFTLNNLSAAPVDTPTSSPMGATAASDLARLWGTDRAGVLSGTQAAAFQLAVWALVYDDSNIHAASNSATHTLSFDVSKKLNSNLSTNQFYVGTATASAIIKDANAYLHDALFGSKTTSDLAALTSPTLQDQLVVLPLPASAWMGLGLLGLIGIGKKMRSTAAR